MELNKEKDGGSDSNSTARHEKEESGEFTGKIKKFLNNVTVEPVFAMYLFPSTLAGIAVQNLTLEKACRINLALDTNICDGMSVRNTSMYNDTDEIDVQKLVAGIYAWKTMIQSIIPSMLLLFLGSWSDRQQRRKPCIILPIIGEALSSIGCLVCTYFFYELSAEYSVLAEVLPTSLTGGWFAMHMAVFSYVSGICSVETRTVRIGAVSTFSYVTYTVGLALSGVVFLAVGFYGVFSIALVLEIIGVLYAYIRLKEIPKNENNANETSKHNFLRSFFDWKHIKETFTIVFKKGKRNRAKRISVIMILVMIICGPQYGEYTVLYLFTRYKFHWDEFQFSLFCTYNAIVITAATILSLSFFSKYLKFDDSLVGIISGSSKVLSSFVYAFAPNSTIFYLVLSYLLPCKSLIKCTNIGTLLLGKVYSLFGVCEALMPLVYGPTYTTLYKATINTMPGAFYLVGGFISFPSILMFWWLYSEHKKDIKQLEEAVPLKERQ
ncbi:hypothetical protein RI129_003440 [Pyrocoelia pectoralis]|uniref:Solute carrier family 46 member 3 n=1 Tax=Pyrocoelia pectoralis TaxID=417401 RepID=A0AAN7ZV28_9COLE